MKLCLLFREDFDTSMASKFADKSGSLTPSVTGCRGNYRIPGVADAHHIVRRGHEGEHPARPFLSAVGRFSEITGGFHPNILFRVVTTAARGRRGDLGAKTLQGGPGVNEDAVHGEILIRQQSDGRRRLFGAPEQGRGQVRTKKALLILGKDASKFQVICDKY